VADGHEHIQHAVAKWRQRVVGAGCKVIMAKGSTHGMARQLECIDVEMSPDSLISLRRTSPNPPTPARRHWALAFIPGS